MISFFGSGRFDGFVKIDFSRKAAKNAKKNHKEAPANRGIEPDAP
jgi:hypothetical protein